MSLTLVDVPICEWTLIVSNTKQGRIRIIQENPSKYYYIIVPAGEAAPTNKPIEGTLFIGTDFNINFREPIDFYMAAFNFAGKVIFDSDANYIDTFIQDQHTPVIIEKFNQVHDSTTMSVGSAIFDETITVTDPTGIIVGSHIILFSVTLIRFSSYTAIGVAGSVITLDSPLDAPFPAGTFVDVAITDMAVDGSVTRQVFGLRGTGVIPGIEVKADITRIIITCFTLTAVDLSKFGNLAKLTRGWLLRFRNGDVFNVFNVKDNGEIAGITLDWIPYSAQNTQQGQHGFTARLTFAGQSKLGVTERLAAGEDLEFVIQDNLLLIESLEVEAEGHIVD